ncbi:hypothetical protein ACQKL0_15590 [Peribacillus sp. NPDC097264]|uniref:hypothetical protein n=1 Tax=Peribacillus sp. NPDC097264 TaxID=3390616 RepID=UPI003CFD9265
MNSYSKTHVQKTGHHGRRIRKTRKIIKSVVLDVQHVVPNAVLAGTALLVVLVVVLAGIALLAALVVVLAGTVLLAVLVVVLAGTALLAALNVVLAGTVLLAALNVVLAGTALLAALNVVLAGIVLLAALVVALAETVLLAALNVVLAEIVVPLGTAELQETTDSMEKVLSASTRTGNGISDYRQINRINIGSSRPILKGDRFIITSFYIIIELPERVISSSESINLNIECQTLTLKKMDSPDYYPGKPTSSLI